MKRALCFSVVAALALTTAASAQLMGNGVFWFSGDGGVPMYTPSVDNNVGDMESNGYHLSWAPSGISPIPRRMMP